MGAVAIPRALPLEPLSPAEDRFCHEYVANGGNATKAYLRTHEGVSYDAAAVSASRMLKKAKVQERVSELAYEAKRAAKLLPEQVVEHLEQIVLTDPADVWMRDPLGRRMALRPFEEMPPEVRGAIQEISIEPTQYGTKQRVKLYSKLEAAKALAQIHGLIEQGRIERERVTERWVIVMPQQMSPEDWRKLYAPTTPTLEGK
jgi:phage terminase small subunit